MTRIRINHGDEEALSLLWQTFSRMATPPDYSQFPALATIDISFENCQNTSKHNVSITTLTKLLTSIIPEKATTVAPREGLSGH